VESDNAFQDNLQRKEEAKKRKWQASYGKLGPGLHPYAGGSHGGIGENSVDRKRSWPPGREQIEERSAFQQGVLLNGNLKAVLRQKLLNFL
jgi:hypothetical protein